MMRRKKYRAPRIFYRMQFSPSDTIRQKQDNRMINERCLIASCIKKEKRHAPLPKGLELVGLRNENLYNSFRRKLLPKRGSQDGIP